MPQQKQVSQYSQRNQSRKNIRSKHCQQDLIKVNFSDHRSTLVKAVKLPLNYCFFKEYFRIFLFCRN